MGPRQMADVIESPIVFRGEMIFGGLFTCFLVTLLTALRYGRGILFLTLALTPLLLGWILSQLRFASVSLVAEYALRAEVATAGFVLTLALTVPRRLRVSRLVEVLSVIGCSFAPLIPLLWIARLIPGFDTTELTAGLLIDFVARPDSFAMPMVEVDAETLYRFDEVANQYFAGIPLHWVCLVGSLLCSLLAARILMNVWRARCLAPQ